MAAMTLPASTSGRPAAPTAERLLALFRTMVKIRRVEEKIVELYPSQQMRCPVHLSIGQEAAAAGVCSELRPEDWVMSSHRSHGHYVARGGDLKAMLAELYGKATGCCGGKGGSMHFIDQQAGFLGATPIVGSTIAIATGAAFGSQLKGEKRVVVAFFGEAATEEGVFHEAANFAALRKLPIVFVCENNLYSVYSPMSVRQPEGLAVVEAARAHGIEAHAGDGNDPVAVAALTRPALEKARAGGGPSFLEFKTYRWREHCGTSFDNDIGYRTEAEFQEWRKRCPVETFRARLLREALADETELARLEAEVQAEVHEAARFAIESPYPAASELMTDVYSPAKEPRA